VVLRLILGAVYTAMALGQLVSWPAMPGILAAYQVIPEPGLPWLAAGLIAGELVCGLWFLSRPRSHALAPVRVYTGVSVDWACRRSPADWPWTCVGASGCISGSA
jgi:hypothetical protein